MKTIHEFRGKYSFLSNFYLCKIVYKGKVYYSSEHLFQALKTKNKKEREKIRKAKSPGEAKKLGRQISFRKDWSIVRVRKMYKVLKLKFTQNPDLAKQLIKTKDAYLVEGNWWHDNFWGICNCSTCREGIKHVPQHVLYKDGNQLGQLLMALRKELKRRKH